MRASVFFASVIVVAVLTGCSVDGSAVVAKDDAQSHTTEETTTAPPTTEPDVFTKSEYHGDVNEVTVQFESIIDCASSNVAILTVTFTAAGDGEVGLLVGDLRPELYDEDPYDKYAEASLLREKISIIGQDAFQREVQVPIIDGQDVVVVATAIGGSEDLKQNPNDTTTVLGTQCLGTWWQN